MKILAGTYTVTSDIFDGSTRMQGCSVPLPRISQPGLMRARDAEWLIEQAWAEHDWPSGGTALLRRHRTVLLALASDDRGAERG